MPGFPDGLDAKAQPERVPTRSAPGGVSPREFFLLQVQRSLKQARSKRPTSLLILRFRSTEQRINDLPIWRKSERRALTEALGRLIPSDAQVGQLGGNELAALLPGIAISEIERLAERLAEAVREEQRAHTESRFMEVAIGIACSSQSRHEASALLSLAAIAVNYADASRSGWHVLVDAVPGQDGINYKVA
jgi:GGDEF domain-containing protein